MNIKDKEFHYSETFYSMQGEGHYTGRPTVWLRYFLCNLQCNGFGQIDPTNPEKYFLPYQALDVEEKDLMGEPKYKVMEDLPVFEHGCDSSYSWSKKFKHLQRKGTPDEISKVLEDLLPNTCSFSNVHLCFTGGEPLMRHAQACTLGIIRSLVERDNPPMNITFETNGTQALTDDFFQHFNWYGTTAGFPEVFWSVSPKLWTVAGEKPEKAIKPENVAYYAEVNNCNGQLKFVANGTKECWEEIDSVINEFRAAGVDWPIWIMPVGATVEGQKAQIKGHHYEDGDIADMALQRGWNVSARVHTYLWGNKNGV